MLWLFVWGTVAVTNRWQLHQGWCRQQYGLPVSQRYPVSQKHQRLELMDWYFVRHSAAHAETVQLMLLTNAKEDRDQFVSEQLV